MKIFQKSIIIFISFLIITSCNNKTFSPNTNKSNIRSILSSKCWNWKHKGCEENRYCFSFEDHKMTINFDKPVQKQHTNEYISKAEYIIIGTIKNGLKTKMINEHRLDRNRKFVEWHIILENDSTFYWKRADLLHYPNDKPFIACENDVQS